MGRLFSPSRLELKKLSRQPRQPFRRPHIFSADKTPVGADAGLYFRPHFFGSSGSPNFPKVIIIIFYIAYRRRQFAETYLAIIVQNPNFVPSFADIISFPIQSVAIHLSLGMSQYFTVDFF